MGVNVHNANSNAGVKITDIAYNKKAKLQTNWISCKNFILEINLSVLHKINESGKVTQKMRQFPMIYCSLAVIRRVQACDCKVRVFDAVMASIYTPGDIKHHRRCSDNKYVSEEQNVRRHSKS